MLVAIVRVEAVEHRGHPPREVLRAPHAAQARVGVGLEQAVVARLVVAHERLREPHDVGDGEVQALRARGRDDVGGVAGEEEAPVLHRLDDPAAQRCEQALDDGPLAQREAVVRGRARPELLPDALVGPILDVLVGRHLEVEAADRRRAQAAQAEAALVVGVDQLLRRRRDLGEDPEPGEGIDTVELGEHAGRDRLARHAVEAVAAGDDVALERLRLALVCERDARRVAVDALEAEVGDLEADVAARLEAAGDEVLDDLLLAVDGDRPPAGQPAQVDPVALAVEAQLDAVMDEPLACQAVAEPGLGQELDGALLEDAGADAVLDVLAAAGLEDDGVDALEVQEVRQHQPGGPGTDDSDLCPHLYEALPYPVARRSIPNAFVAMRAGYPGRTHSVRLAAVHVALTPRAYARAMVFRDPGRCPGCGERVTPYAAGCAFCGADLDPKRWQAPPSPVRRLLGGLRRPSGSRAGSAGSPARRSRA